MVVIGVGFWCVAGGLVAYTHTGANTGTAVTVVVGVAEIDDIQCLSIEGELAVVVTLFIHGGDGGTTMPVCLSTLIFTVPPVRLVSTVC